MPQHFPQDYWTSFDRNAYYSSFEAIGGKEEYTKANPDTFSIKQVGSSRWLDGQNKNPIRAVMGDIRSGAGHIELTAPGTDRGGGNASTFEEIDAQQRAELLDIQKAVEDVTITTHATPSVWGLSGYNPQQQAFDENERGKGLGEIKKAIDFASEATFGGSVVMHTGEFQRPLHNLPGQEGNFKMYNEEDQDASYGVVDPTTKRVIANMNNRQPINIAQTNDENTDVILRDDIKNFNDYVENEILKDPESRKQVAAYVKQFGGNPDKLSPDDVLVKEISAKLYTQKEQFERQIDQAISQLKYQNITLQSYKQRAEQLGDQEELESINDQLRENNKRVEEIQRDFADRKDKLQTVREYSLNKSHDSYAELGVYAYEKTKALKLKHKNSGHEEKVKPIYITLENIYPAGPQDSGFMGYGAAADELINLVRESRVDMAKKLEDRGIAARDAKKAAEKHIRATFDTGHFNMWRKFFVRKPKEDDEAYDKRFKKWYLGEVQKLADSGIIGNVHLADNYGYADTHLSPGEGNTPVKETLDILKKSGYGKEGEKMIVEGGFGQGKTGFHETWKMMGVPVSSRAAQSTWTDLGASFDKGHQSYHFQRHSPYFVFGQYAPQDVEEWRPWSGTRME